MNWGMLLRVCCLFSPSFVLYCTVLYHKSSSSSSSLTEPFSSKKGRKPGICVPACVLIRHIHTCYCSCVLCVVGILCIYTIHYTLYTIYIYTHTHTRHTSHHTLRFMEQLGCCQWLLAIYCIKLFVPWKGWCAVMCEQLCGTVCWLLTAKLKLEEQELSERGRICTNSIHTTTYNI